MPLFLVGAVSASHCSGVLGIAPIFVERFRFVDVRYNRHVKPAARSALGYVFAAFVVLVIVVLGRSLVRVNPTTVALAFLLGVLAISTFWGLRQAVFMAVISTLAFNYFFLPPLGTFTIS